MKNHFLRRICLLLAISMSLIFCGCTNETNKSKTKTNDREYQMSELIGEYTFSMDRNGTTYDYKLVITGNNGKATRESYTWESQRQGITWKDDLYSGTVSLTRESIEIGGRQGYIETIDGVITITIQDIAYRKK